MLPEQRAWRQFARLRRPTQVPGVRVLHEFRGRLGVAGLRQIHGHLLAPLLEQYAWQPSLSARSSSQRSAACASWATGQVWSGPPPPLSAAGTIISIIVPDIPRFRDRQKAKFATRQTEPGRAPAAQRGPTALRRPPAGERAALDPQPGRRYPNGHPHGRCRNSPERAFPTRRRVS